MTYNVSSVTLNLAVPYTTLFLIVSFRWNVAVLVAIATLRENGYRQWLCDHVFKFARWQHPAVWHRGEVCCAWRCV